MGKSLKGIRTRPGQTTASTGGTPEGRSPPRAVTRVGLPRFLQCDRNDHAVSRASDPAEHEARNVASEVARESASASTAASGAQHASSQTDNRALPDDLRAPMEQSFGTDFGDVRVHSDAAASDACRALDARAYTVGNAIHIRPEEYRPHEPAGRELIAHELTHVVQQRGASPANGGPTPIQRQPATTAAPPESLALSDGTATQAQWRRRVDGAVRSRYGIRGDGITASQVDVVDRDEFARRFPTSQMEEILFDLFLSEGARHMGTIAQILDFNRHPYLLAGPSSPSAVSQLRTFVQEGITRGYFEGQTREYDVTTGERFPAFRVTPGELIAGNVGGVTTISPNSRSGRRITLQVHAYVHTFVHEACHFYISNSYRDMAQGRTDGGEYLRGARISQVLLEGMAEYFSRGVMEANPSELGPPNEGVYPDETRVAEDLIVTLGESSVRRAYFHGVAADIRRVAAAIDEYKTIHEDLLVPGFVVDERLRTTRPTTP